MGIDALAAEPFSIPTSYAGCRFRSRLEARWAVFFDTLGLAWEYEPQGFDTCALRDALLADGSRDSDYYLDGLGRLGGYLPDFWLPAPGIWFEVKGADPDRDDGRFDVFALSVAAGLVKGRRAVMYVGGIPRPDRVEAAGPPYEGESGGHVLADLHYVWCRCAWCGAYDLTFDARSARCYCECRKRLGIDSDKDYTGDHPTILFAYRAAREARFEHGENG